MLVSLGVLTQHPSVNLVWEKSDSCLMPTHLSNLTSAFSKKQIPLPLATCTGPKGLNSVVFQQGEGDLSHFLQPRFFKQAYKTHLKY